MPAVTDPIQESFPEDDRLYRIYWGGELLLPKPDNATSRVRFWLKEVDEDDREIKESPIVQVTESVGAIPRLTIGSHWRNGRKARPKNSKPPRIECLEFNAPPVWKIVRACDRVPDDPDFCGIPHSWINRSEMSLLFNTSTGQEVRGLNAWVISARTIHGREIIISCYEIFRSFFGGTSDLSFALLSQTWDAAEKKFIVGSHESTSDNGVNWHIDLANRVPHCAVPYLSWLHFDKAARKAANKIYPATVNQMTPQPWISAAPPVTNQPLRIVANVVHLFSRGALLVTKIVGIDFPVKVASLSYTVDWRDIPFSTSAIDTVDVPQEAIPIKRPSTVSKPLDRRCTLG